MKPGVLWNWLRWTCLFQTKHQSWSVSRTCGGSRLSFQFGNHGFFEGPCCWAGKRPGNSKTVRWYHRQRVATSIIVAGNESGTPLWEPLRESSYLKWASMEQIDIICKKNAYLCEGANKKGLQNRFSVNPWFYCGAEGGTWTRTTVGHYPLKTILW